MLPRHGTSRPDLFSKESRLLDRFTFHDEMVPTARFALALAGF